MPPEVAHSPRGFSTTPLHLPSAILRSFPNTVDLTGLPFVNFNRTSVNRLIQRTSFCFSIGIWPPSTGIKNVPSVRAKFFWSSLILPSSAAAPAFKFLHVPPPSDGAPGFPRSASFRKFLLGISLPDRSWTVISYCPLLTASALLLLYKDLWKGSSCSFLKLAYSALHIFIKKLTRLVFCIFHLIIKEDLIVKCLLVTFTNGIFISCRHNNI